MVTRIGEKAEGGDKYIGPQIETLQNSVTHEQQDTAPVKDATSYQL